MDVTRITYYLLLPVCLVLALFFVSQGMIQNFKSYTTAKLIEPQTVSYVHEVIPSLDAFGQLMGKAFAQLGQQGLKPAGAPFALYYDTEFHEQNVDVEVAIPVGAAPANSAAVRQLPGGTVACVVYQGGYDSIGSVYATLIAWIERNGYRITGACREIYLRGPESGNDPASYMTEVQFPVEKD